MDTGSEKNKSDEILDAVKKLKDKGRIVDVEEEKLKLVVFSLQGDYYAFYGSDIKEILPYSKIFNVPGAPEFILGVINVRGDIESVISVGYFLGMNAENKKQGRIAVAEKNGVRSGIIVDSIEDVVDFPISSIKPPLSTLDRAKRDFIAGETLYRGRNVTVIDVSSIFERIKI